MVDHTAVSPSEPPAAQPSPAEVDRALRDALDAREWPRAVALIGEHWSLLLDEPGDLLDHALHFVPVNAFDRDPRAAAVRDIRLHSSADAVDRMLGTATLPDADDLATLENLARSERALSLVSVACARMIALRVRGRMTRALQLAVLVERLGRIAVVHQPATVASRLPAALLHTGITRGLAGDLPGALLALRDAYERGPEARGAHVLRDAAGKSALFLALDGDIEQARLWLDRHDRAPELSGWYRPRVALTADVARAIVATEALQADEAATRVRMLDQPVNAEQSWGPTVTYARARHALAWGDRLGALDALRIDRARYADWLGDDTTMAPLLAQAEVDLLLSLGQVRPALRLLDGQPDAPSTDALRARALLVEGDVADAERRAAAALGERMPTRLRIDALVTHAVAKQRQSGAGAPDAASSDLRAAARERGLLLPLLGVPPEARAPFADMLPPDHGARDVFRADPERIRITPQQLVVLQGLERRLTVREIALRSHLSVNTVKSHARALYRRLEVSTRDEVVARAYELGLL